MIEEIFKNKNIKLTKQRRLVYDIVNNSDEDATIKYIIENCSKQVDTATIYRIIETFLEKEIFHKKINFDNEIFYEVINNDHIHYINCIKCHKKTKIDECPFSEIEKEICDKEKYTMISHEIEFNGICSECNKKDK